MKRVDSPNWTDSFTAGNPRDAGNPRSASSSPGPSEQHRILFVCSGNTCRSPMAEVIGEEAVQSMALHQVEVRSAGTHTRTGLPASTGALRAAERNGLSLAQHASTELTSDLVEWADLILAMGPGHLARIDLLGGGEKAFLLGEYAAQGPRDVGGPRGQDFAVPDPFGGDDEVYERTFQTLKQYVRSAMKRLSEEWGG